MDHIMLTHHKGNKIIIKKAILKEALPGRDNETTFCILDMLGKDGEDVTVSVLESVEDIMEMLNDSN